MESIIGQLSFTERACAFCCGVMAEMGNLLGISYQKVNVILFCWMEPGICLLLCFALVWGFLHLPGCKALGWISLGLSSLAILATAILIAMAALMLVMHLQEGLADPTSIFNMTESHPLFASRFTEAVDNLTKMAGALHISYAAVNLLYYVLLLPVGIIMGYWGTLKNLLTA